MKQNNEPKLWNAGLYLRLSKDDRDKAESNSIKNQREMLLDFVNRNPDIRTARIFADDGFTGANFDRDAFKDMIRYIENGDIDCVIVKDFSRLGRDHIGTGKYIERYFAAKKIRFIAVNEPYDSLESDMTDPGNSLIVPFKNIINEAFLEDISVKTKSQLEIKRKNGELVCNYAPYGYLKRVGKLVVDAYAADVVKSIFDCKITGYSEGQIAAMLNARGILSPAEYKKAAGVSYHTPFKVNEKPEWSPNAVKRILSNRVYIGCLEQGKRTKASYRVKRFYYKPREQWSVHENAHEPIVDALDFELAQELMAMDTRSAHGGSPLHLFSGFAVCGSCGQPMTAKTTTKRNGKTYINYICSTHKKTGGCQNNNVSEIKLSGIVLTAIQRQVSGLMEAREIDNGAAASTLKSRKRAAIEEMIGRNLQAIEENSDYLVKSYVHFNDGVISEAEYQMFKNSFNSQIRTAEGNITAFRGELDSLHDNARAKRLIERFVEYGNITELNRRIVAGLIKTVTVNSNQDIAINFRYIGDFDILMTRKGRWSDMARKSRKLAQAGDFTPAAVNASSQAWIYARISHDSDHAGDSIENQIAICKAYIHSGTEFILGGVFTDLGYSGTDFERPGYSDMMSGILDGTVKCVIVKDLSRLGRTYIEVGELLFDTFVQRGVRFVSVNDRYDSFADDAGRKKLLLLFKSLVNHMYSRDLGKKIKSVHAAKKKRGEPAGLPPYGYRHGAKRLEIEPEEAETVRMIFDMRYNGESAIGISRVLNQKGVPSPQNRRFQLGEISHEFFSKRIVWTAGLVSRILHNETYTGALIQGKYACNGKKHSLLPKNEWIIHENRHDAIIDKRRFEAVARLLEETASRYRHTNIREREENRYAGLITCGRCGKTAVRSENCLKEPILYYYSCPHCLNELKHEQGLKRGARLPLTRLDAIVVETMQKQIDALVKFDDLAENLLQSNPLREKRAALAKEASRLEKELSGDAQNLAAAYTHHLEGVLDLREYELIRDRIGRGKEEKEARIANLKADQARYDAKNILENQWLVKYRAFRGCEAPTKEMIQALVGKIVLTPLTNEVRVIMNYADSFEDLKQLAEESLGGAI